MPRYFFSIHDGDLVPDSEGQCLKGVESARQAAVEAAREMIAEEVKAGRLSLKDSIAIHDESGGLVATVSFRDVVAIDGDIA